MTPTRGPYTVEERGVDLCICAPITYHLDASGIARNADPIAEMIAGDEAPLKNSEIEATAILLAASWELREALEALVEYVETWDDVNDPTLNAQWSAAVKALARAKGGA